METLHWRGHLTNAGQRSQLRAELLDKSSNFVGRRLVRDPLLQQGHLHHHHHHHRHHLIGWSDQINADVTELALSGKAGWGREEGEQKKEEGKEFHPRF